MTILDSQLVALQEIENASKKLEDILVGQFQKKLEARFSRKCIVNKRLTCSKSHRVVYKKKIMKSWILIK
jgi:hypothetical protein